MHKKIETVIILTQINKGEYAGKTLRSYLRIRCLQTLLPQIESQGVEAASEPSEYHYVAGTRSE